MTSVNPPTTEWIYLPMNPRDQPPVGQYLSFNTPVGTPEAMQCGKAVFTDIHIKTVVGRHGRRRLGSEQAVPVGLQDQHDVAAGEGARVPVLRPHVVRRAADDDADAAAAGAARIDARAAALHFQAARDSAATAAAAAA